MAVKVRAHQLGFWDNTRRRPGDEFEVPDEFADRSKWFHRADGKPPAEIEAERRITAPGNANAHHVPGSAADERRKRPASSARRAPKGDAAPAEGEGDGEDDGDEPGDASQDETAAITRKGKGKGTGDRKVI